MREASPLSSCFTRHLNLKQRFNGHLTNGITPQLSWHDKLIATIIELIWSGFLQYVFLKLKLPPRNFLNQPTSQAAVYIHVSPVSYYKCSVDLGRMKEKVISVFFFFLFCFVCLFVMLLFRTCMSCNTINVEMDFITILTCMITVNNFQWETCCLHLWRTHTWPQLQPGAQRRTGKKGEAMEGHRQKEEENTDVAFVKLPLLITHMLCCSTEKKICKPDYWTVLRSELKLWKPQKLEFISSLNISNTLEKQIATGVKWKNNEAILKLQHLCMLQYMMSFYDYQQAKKWSSANIWGYLLLLLRIH